jgi:hypothetical protein
MTSLVLFDGTQPASVLTTASEMNNTAWQRTYRNKYGAVARSFRSSPFES